MSGNQRLSRPHEGRPPAGGFGAAAPAGDGIVRLPAPKRRPHIVLIVGVLVVAGAVGGIYRLALNELHTAQHLSARRDIEEAMPFIENSFTARGGRLCPSAKPLPPDVTDLPSDVDAKDFKDDVGWSCLGYVRSGPMLNQLRFDVTNGARFELTATSPADRQDLPAAVILRGHVDVEKNELVFDPIEERGRK